MSESVERAPVGEAHTGRPCGFCQAPLEAGDQAAICGACSALHHEACWDRELGCSTSGCLNAPLKRLDAPARGEAGHAPSPPKPKKKKPSSGPRSCVDCGAILDPDGEVCESCFAINTPDGLYHGPKKTSPHARQALIYGLIGLFVCGPILGPAAIAEANKAKAAIKRDPRLEGEGLATAGYVLGILALLSWAWVLFSRVGGAR